MQKFQWRSHISAYFSLKSHRRQLIYSILLVLLFAALAYFGLKLLAPLKLTYATLDQNITQPFVVRFNSTIDSILPQNITISPVVQGTWVFQSGHVIGQDQLTFTPTTRFTVNTTYSIVIKDILRPLGNTAHIGAVTFKTQTAPGLADIGVANLQNSSTVAADYTFKADLTAPSAGLRDLKLQTTPAIDVIRTSSDDRQFSWKPAKLLPQGTTISVAIYDAKNDVTLSKRLIKVAEEPTIVTPVQKDHFGAHDTATITFSQAMAPASSTYIEFDTPGVGMWQSDTIYAFTPQKVEAGHSYTYTLKQGLRSKEGGVLSVDQVNTYATVGTAYTVASSPKGSGLTQASEKISFTFDQPVDHASAVQHFSVSAGTVDAITWTNNTLNALVTDLGYQQTITATVSAGIKNAGFGLPSAQSFSTSFTTEIRVLKYAVPYYHQQYAGSCAAASLRMILAYRGIAVDDMAIVNKMGYAPSVEDTSTDPASWDDPWQQFVGSVDGTIKSGTGAGPDAPPIAKAAQSYGLRASYVMGTNVNWIAQQVYDGGLVVFFGSFSATGFTSWKTPSGRIETMNLTSHAYTITGVKGNPDNPIGFWVSDPISGATYWTATQTAANLARDAYQQAVVVF
jgi:uncharacterized protein YvpB